ncbi:PD-(D/E)XK nuclease domain-containing protein [Treponema primitia]|uniref:ATP-binding protein n=1 Tax=Treponema primitia TaxID=88058 RepID=UPI00397F39DE
MMDKRPVRFFNTTGPCRPEMHYMLPPEERLGGAQLHRYIRDQLYWVLHAPRQTGKTTFLQSWARDINVASNNGDSDRAIACYVSVERCQGVTETEKAMPGICEAIQEYASSSDLPVPEISTIDTNSILSNILRNWSALVAPKPLVVLFDEVDVLQGKPLISFLRQLRGGFAIRGVGQFPASIALVGMRDLKDYITAAKDGVAPNPGSPFNIKEDSATLSNFQKDDVNRLFAQRTQETGQQITQDALDYVYEQSKGQPWIVNSLFKRATMRILDEDSAETVTIEHIQEARKQMIEARETHLDALAYRLEDPAIRSVMETLITGEPDTRLAAGEPFRLCLDLGLVTIERGSPVVANPIYREVIARQITFATQMAIPEPEWKWQKSDGTLDMENLLREFQDFWRNNSEIWEQQADYPEAFPHLLLMAFLQRVTNGHGRIEREYAAGRGRMDLAVEFNGSWDIIEVKLLRQNRTFEMVQAEGKKQILRYRDNFAPTPGKRALRSSDGGAADCYLVIFDRRSGKLPWSERLKWIQDEEITVVGC